MSQDPEEGVERFTRAEKGKGREFTDPHQILTKEARQETEETERAIFFAATEAIEEGPVEEEDEEEGLEIPSTAEEQAISANPSGGVIAEAGVKGGRGKKSSKRKAISVKKATKGGSSKGDPDYVATSKSKTSAAGAKAPDYNTKSNNKAIHLDDYARLLFNPYTPLDCGFIIYHFYGLTHTVYFGKKHKAETKDFLLGKNSPKFPYTFATESVNARIGEADRPQYAQHSQPFYEVMGAIFDAVSTVLEFNLDDAWHALRAEGAYRPGRPETFDRRKPVPSQLSFLANMLRIPDDVYFFCVLLWAGREAIEPEFDPKPRLPLKESIPDLFTRMDYMSLLTRPYQTFLFHYFERITTKNKENVAKILKRLDEKRGAELETGIKAVRRAADASSIDNEKMYESIKGLEGLITNTHSAATRLRDIPSDSLSEILSRARNLIDDTLDNAREMMTTQLPSDYAHVIAERTAEATNVNSESTGLVASSSSQATSSDLQPYTGDEPLHHLHGVHGEREEPTLGMDYLINLPKRFIINTIDTRLKEAELGIKGAGEMEWRDWPGLCQFDSESLVANPDPRLPDYHPPLLLRPTQASGAFRVLHQQHLNENPTDFPAHTTDGAVTKAHSSLIVCGDDVGLGKTAMTCAVYAVNILLATETRDDKSKYRGDFRISSRKHLYSDEKPKDAESAQERWEDWRELIVANALGEQDEDVGLIGTFANTPDYLPPSHPSLLIVPAAAIPHWIKELHRFIPGVHIKTLNHDSDESTLVEELKRRIDDDPDTAVRTILIINIPRAISLYHRHAKMTSQAQKATTLLSVPFLLGILDEAHVGRSENDTHFALKALLAQAAFRLLLSATVTINSIRDLVHILSLGGFEPLAQIFSKKSRLRPEPYNVYKQEEAKEARERRKKMKETSRGWHQPNPAADDTSPAGGAGDPMVESARMRKAKEELLEMIKPMLFRRPRTVRDHDGQPVLRLGKCIKQVRIVTRSEEEDRWVRLVLALFIRDNNIPEAALSTFGPFYVLAKRLLVCPGWVGYIYTGVPFHPPSAKLVESCDILQSIQVENHTKPLSAQIKAAVYYPFPEDYPDIIRYYASRNIYVRVISGQTSPHARSALLDEINMDEDHESERLSPGEQGRPTRFILISMAVAESINAFRVGVLISIGFSPNQDLQLLGRFHRTPPDPHHPYSINPPPVLFITISAPQSADDASWLIQTAKTARAAGITSGTADAAIANVVAGQASTSAGAQQSTATNTGTASPIVVPNSPNQQPATAPSSHPAESTTPVSTSRDRPLFEYGSLDDKEKANIKKSERYFARLGLSEFVNAIKRQPAKRTCLQPSKDPKTKPIALAFHNAPADITFERGERSCHMANLYFSSKHLNDTDSELPKIIGGQDNKKPNAIHTALQSARSMKEAALAPGGKYPAGYGKFLSPEETRRIMQEIRNPPKYDDLLKEWKAKNASDDISDMGLKEVTARLIALHRALHRWRAQRIQDARERRTKWVVTTPSPKHVVFNEFTRAFARAFKTWEPDLVTMVIPDPENFWEYSKEQDGSEKFDENTRSTFEPSLVDADYGFSWWQEPDRPPTIVHHSRQLYSLPPPSDLGSDEEIDPSASPPGSSPSPQEPLFSPASQDSDTLVNSARHTPFSRYNSPNPSSTPFSQKRLSLSTTPPQHSGPSRARRSPSIDPNPFSPPNPSTVWNVPKGFPEYLDPEDREEDEASPRKKRRSLLPHPDAEED